VYYKVSGKNRAEELYSFLTSKGMSPDRLSKGLGVYGPRSIVYYKGYEGIATWLSDHINILKGFTIRNADRDDEGEGILINLW
jgi:hypothetical protein